MARCDRAHPNARNFGLGARDMARAGLHALREGMQSHSSIATMADRWAQFAAWARDTAGIKDMRHIEASTLRDYATHLIERLERGEISPATAQNALSCSIPCARRGCRSVAGSPPLIGPCRCPSTTTCCQRCRSGWPPSSPCSGNSGCGLRRLQKWTPSGR